MSPTTIFQRQNEDDALLLARAFRRRYAVARRFRVARLGASISLGTVGVVVALLEPSTGEYISAVAAAWLLFSRAVLDVYEQRLRRDGAQAQELFDTKVLDLPWSAGAVGVRPVDEDIRNWARRQSIDGLRDWYADTGTARHPVDVLICQRSTITWARQDHANYAQFLRWTAGGIFLLTIVLGLLLDLSLAGYLLRPGLPMLPALIEILDIAQANSQVAHAKARLEDQARDLLERAEVTGRPPTVDDCRQLQNGIYATRLLPGVPNWMYWLTRKGRQQNMEGSVLTQVQRLPASLR
ncbi:MAG TPA: S-4TM family putative pore-forming effector [Thermoleophilaceae bacterium]|jgi:hypothetical protein